MEVVNRREIPNFAQAKLVNEAAAAAGIMISWVDEHGWILAGSPARAWNPISDNGDAIQLAERLLMSMVVDNAGVRVWIGDDEVTENQLPAYEGMRYAIVKLAAEIGRNTTSDHSFTK